MARQIVLASGSAIRGQMLSNAGIAFEAIVPRVDEEMIKIALQAEKATPRDIADALAETKARKIGGKHPDKLVIGCDQVLDFDGQILSKPQTPDEAKEQLKALRGKRHCLLSAVVVYHELEPLWRHVGQVRLYMRDISDSYLNEYVERNWPSLQSSVGGYKLEEEGVRLFSRIEGDYFTILGLPLIEMINYLTASGDLKA
ncbi:MULTISPECIES: nucleoside triphosphate pyrophosphatase [Lentibacter]|jgi:septum formation protein|uniref:Nucleoside triphosphate pyrophosphatase n=1 Tax=Lentibacter algarum TaxID=576131 RepID=A0A1H3MKL6_9RHOB|nr:nucleoside triphosphate pyrophosphatase [Lentibacter algarum]MCO4828856.1 septum formation protein Maf [Lentibacter algarum]SDY77262.1 septum formation protein [Lentibacter algarum]